MSAEEPTARFLAERADGFLRAAEQRHGTRTTSIESDLHAVCCAIELSLKAILLAAGHTDQQNRRDIRHSLTKATAAARASGFTAAEELAAIAEGLSPYYERHRLRDLATRTTRPELDNIVAATRRHVAATVAWLRKGDADGGLR